MRFIRIGDHLVNVAEVCCIHFDKGNHIDIVFDNRMLSGVVSQETFRKLCSMAHDITSDESSLVETRFEEVPEQRLVEAAAGLALRETGELRGQDVEDLILISDAWMSEHGLA